MRNEVRARNIKPGFFRNPELADAGPIAQLLFAGLWCLADRDGRLKDNPRVIKAELFPFYEADVNGELTVLERLGHIVRYVAGGVAVIQVVNFAKHQSPHHTEKTGELPARLDNGVLTVKSPLENGGNPSDSLIPDSPIHRFTDSLIPDSYSVIEAIKIGYPAGTFGAQNWILAEKAIRKLLDSGETTETLNAAALAYREQMDAKGSTGTQFIRSPEKFYGEGFWRGPFPLPAAATKKTAADKLTWAPTE